MHNLMHVSEKEDMVGLASMLLQLGNSRGPNHRVGAGVFSINYLCDNIAWSVELTRLRRSAYHP